MKNSKTILTALLVLFAACQSSSKSADEQAKDKADKPTVSPAKTLDKTKPATPKTAVATGPTETIQLRVLGMT